MMHSKIEKNLSALWHILKPYAPPQSHMRKDIEEFLNAHEFGLALELMVELAHANNLMHVIEEKAARIRKEMHL